MVCQNKRAVITALFMNSAVAAAKFIAAIFSGSSAMLAEAYHSVSDTFNQIFLLMGIQFSKKPADNDHPFGYGMEQFFWSFIVAMFIFGIAGFLSFREGMHKLLHPSNIENFYVTYVVLVVSILFEGYALNTAYKQFRHSMKEEKMTSYLEGIRHSKDPVTLAVLFEDTLAILGLSIALIALIVTQVTHNVLWDALASLVIGVMLMIFALVLAYETKKLLIGEAVTPYKRQRLLQVIGKVPGVKNLVSLKTMHFGPEKVLVNAEVNIQDNLTTDEVEEIIDEVEKKIQEVIPAAECSIEAEDEEEIENEEE